MQSVGERIAYLRKSKGLKQRELMKLLDFNNLSRFERNEMKPGIEIIVALAEFFNVSTDWLLTGKEKVTEVNTHQVELSPEDIELLAKFHQLSEREQGKVEGMIEGILSGRKADNSSKESSRSKNTGRQDAAAKQVGA
ncbi:helix-turn-helix domain-containing protein [Paenibacillus dendritiformis]|uniref:helix-turn-helix domain-containing protein n=1 Tax=Paenibacillus dendritiformis TaxID=130049 RepID=UPI000DA92856|nr:helix-turn-helix transcriptional regulator [Paenibacillus dendritiformis]PZM63425.1 transcriptional regulator [Paenibacillus dendritiformis]